MVTGVNFNRHGNTGDEEVISAKDGNDWSMHASRRGRNTGWHVKVEEGAHR